MTSDFGARESSQKPQVLGYWELQKTNFSRRKIVAGFLAAIPVVFAIGYLTGALKEVAPDTSGNDSLIDEGTLIDRKCVRPLENYRYAIRMEANRFKI